jgi:DNA-binding PadR family transcriptional regulator
VKFASRPEPDARAVAPLGASTFYILLALAGGDRHGYGVIKEVEAQTSGAVKLGPGTLYRLIKQLLADGWIVEIEGDAADGDERRRYYRLTPRGRAIARAEAERLDSLVAVARERRLLPALAM